MSIVDVEEDKLSGVWSLFVIVLNPTPLVPALPFFADISRTPTAPNFDVSTTP